MSTLEAPVTVVIPAYRAERTIRRTLDSVLAEPAVAAVVVVIDGAVDQTEEVVSSFRSDRVQVIARAENWGASRTRNQGLAQVSTDFVMFLDSDDFVERPLLASLVQAMRSAGADVGFGPMQILHEKEGKRDPRYVPDFTSSADIFRKWHLGGVYVSPCSVLWRTEFISRIGGWDPEITRNDDGELVMRAVLLGAKIAVTGEGCGVYVKHSSESLNNRTDNMASMLRVNEKLIELQSPVISPPVHRRVCAGHYLNIAWHCYLSGRDDLGEEAVRRGRSMGSGRWGPPRYQVPLKLLGIKRTAQIIGWMNRLLSRVREHA